MTEYLDDNGVFDHHKWVRKNGEQLTEDVQSKMIKAIPVGYSHKKLAKDVAGIIHDEFGSHNVKSFLSELKNALNNYNM